VISRFEFTTQGPNSLQGPRSERYPEVVRIASVAGQYISKSGVGLAPLTGQGMEGIAIESKEFPALRLDALSERVGTA
jgi:hypothetical protein